MVVASPRSSALTWGVLALGLVIVVLLAVLIGMRLGKPTTGGQVAETTAQQQAAAQAPPGGTLETGQQQSADPATTNAAGLAQGDQQKVPGAATDAASLAQGQGQNVPPATTNAEGLAQGQQQQVPPATTNAGSLAEGEEEWYDPRQVRSWSPTYRFTGSGTFTTAPMTVRRPWRVKYFTGYASGGMMDLDLFSIFPDTGPLSLPMVTVQNQPNLWGEGYGKKSGTFPLTIVTTYNNWVVIVEQGEF